MQRKRLLLTVVGTMPAFCLILQGGNDRAEVKLVTAQNPASETTTTKQCSLFTLLQQFL